MSSICTRQGLKTFGWVQKSGWGLPQADMRLPNMCRCILGQFTPYARPPCVCRRRRRILRPMSPNQVGALMFMLSIASWNFWLGSNRLVRGTCIGSKLASYCHIETHREPTPWPPLYCPLDNEAIQWHLGADMMRIHLVLVGYTYIDRIFVNMRLIYRIFELEKI